MPRTRGRQRRSCMMLVSGKFVTVRVVFGVNDGYNSGPIAEQAMEDLPFAKLNTLQVSCFPPYHRNDHLLRPVPRTNRAAMAAESTSKGSQLVPGVSRRVSFARLAHFDRRRSLQHPRRLFKRFSKRRTKSSNPTLRSSTVAFYLTTAPRKRSWRFR